MQKIVAYNEKEVKESGSKEDIKQGYNIWIDLWILLKRKFKWYRNYFH